ncbi:MAG TPA: poly-gamma-glutamate hydrolase family protein [Syntrophobacteraceae bacterium]|nr:poly-gamma-glutamate hydrolase family protein [Syntrophobacteraceae bacterium]
MTDKYSCFEHLSANESRGADYEIVRRLGISEIAVIGIHGGGIEPGTSEIAEAVAGPDHSFYTLKGLKEEANKDLHITSTKFDEPEAREIVRRSKTVISIHGCSEAEEIVFLGGLDTALSRCIEEKLKQAGFKTSLTKKDGKFRRLRGRNKRNICNRCGRGMGVQLEISKGLRARLLRHEDTETRRRGEKTGAEGVGAARERAWQEDGVNPSGPPPMLGQGVVSMPRRRFPSGALADFVRAVREAIEEYRSGKCGA